MKIWLTDLHRAYKIKTEQMFCFYFLQIGVKRDGNQNYGNHVGNGETWYTQ